MEEVMSMIAATVDRHVAILPGEGEPFAFGGVGGQFKIGGGATDERFAVAQLREIPPHTLAAPLHRQQDNEIIQ
jgi:hypothetical protein